MQKFNLLIIGDANHQYNIAFSEWLKKVKPEISISIISTNPQILNKKNINAYDQYFSIHSNHSILRKKGLRGFYRDWKIYSIIKSRKYQYNTILFQYGYGWLTRISFFLKGKTSNLVLALWGSDFYRQKSINKLNKLIRSTDNVIIGSPQMLKDVRNKLSPDRSKLHLCYFGNAPIEKLKFFKEKQITKKQSCNFFNWPDDKLNITIGHNGSRSHQHIAILKKLHEIHYNTRKNLRIILPLTYGLTSDYFEEIVQLCKSNMFEVKILTEFMQDDQIAHLRNLTDIMINLQMTDAFSGSMREVLYCGGIVINGSWLPYDFLRSENIYFEEVDSIEKISIKLQEIIQNYQMYKDRCNTNPSKIYSMSSWSQAIHNWIKVIDLKR